MIKYIVLVLLCLSTTCSALNFPSIFKKPSQDERYSSIHDYLQKKHNTSLQQVKLKYKMLGSGAEKVVYRMDIFDLQTGDYLSSLKVAVIKYSEALVLKIVETTTDINATLPNTKRIDDMLNSRIQQHDKDFMFRDNIFVPYYWAEGKKAYGKYVDVDTLFGHGFDEERKANIWFHSFVFFQRANIEFDHKRQPIITGLAIDNNFGNIAFNKSNTSYMDMFHVLDIPLVGGIGDFMSRRLDSLFIMCDFFRQSSYKTAISLGPLVSGLGMRRNISPLKIMLPKNDFNISDFYTFIDAMLYALQKYTIDSVAYIIQVLDSNAYRYFRDNVFSSIIHNGLLSYAKFSPDVDIRFSYSTLYCA